MSSRGCSDRRETTAAIPIYIINEPCSGIVYRRQRRRILVKDDGIPRECGRPRTSCHYFCQTRKWRSASTK